MDKFFTGLGISLIIFGSFLVFQRNNPDRIAFAKNETSEVSILSSNTSLPSSLVIDKLNINLPIITSEIKNGKWEVNNSGVSYLLSSPIPGNKGNSVMYGHNWSNLLGKLINIKIGDEIIIKYEDESVKKFKVILIQEVNPSDTSILNNTNDSRITLYTCSGFLDSKRFVVVANLVQQANF